MATLNAQPDGLRIPPHLIDPAVEEDVRTRVWTVITTGESDPEYLAEYVMDEAELDEDQLSRERAIEIATYLVDARRAQQAGFGPVENRLDIAFKALEQRGVLAEQNFTCCGTCGSAEIGSDIEDFGPWLGYVFFHAQDTERLLESGLTCLNYGSFWPNHVSKAEFDAMDAAVRRSHYEAKTLALMNDVVVPTLEEHGIDVEWNGSIDTRIIISNVEYYAPLT